MTGGYRGWRDMVVFKITKGGATENWLFVVESMALKRTYVRILRESTSNQIGIAVALRVIRIKFICYAFVTVRLAIVGSEG